MVCKWTGTSVRGRRVPAWLASGFGCACSEAVWASGSRRGNFFLLVHTHRGENQAPTCTAFLQGNPQTHERMKNVVYWLPVSSKDVKLVMKTEGYTERVEEREENTLCDPQQTHNLLHTLQNRDRTNREGQRAGETHTLQNNNETENGRSRFYRLKKGRKIQKLIPLTGPSCRNRS